MPMFFRTGDGVKVLEDSGQVRDLAAHADDEIRAARAKMALADRAARRALLRRRLLFVLATLIGIALGAAGAFYCR